MSHENVALNEKNQIEYETQNTVSFAFEKKLSFQILQNINAEEPSVDSAMESESSEYEDEKIEIVEKSIPTTETDEVIQLAEPL